MDRLPPQNVEYEMSILSDALLFQDDRDRIIDNISETDFYKTSHQIIFREIKGLHTSGNPVDINTVVTALRSKDKLETIGGAYYLSEVMNSPVCTNPEYYCGKVVELSNLRKIIELTHRYQQQCFDNPNIEPLIDGIQSEILKIGDRAKDKTFKHISDLVPQAVDRYETLSKIKTGLTGIPTGYRDIDFMTCGLQRKDLVILAARPSMGKTAFAVNAILRGADEGYGAAVFSMEMADSQLADRMIAIKSKLNSIKLRSGRISGVEEWDKIHSAASFLHGLPIWVDDTSSQTYQQIIRKARKLKKHEDISSVWVDYLGFVQGDQTRKRVYEVGEITRAFKGMAKDLNIPVIILSQLNRGLEERSDKRPKLSDLRDSGEIEQDADVVLFLHREEQYLKNNKKSPEYLKWKGIAEINIAKQRNGPTGVIKLAWQEQTTEFLDLARGEA